MIHSKVYFKSFFGVIAAIIVAISTMSVQSFANTAPLIQATEREQSFLIEHTIHSQFPKQERLVSVRLPDSYHERPNAHYPVLYILDGEDNLAFTTASVSFLENGGQMPELIIVALHAGTTRGADYSSNFMDQISTEMEVKSPFLNYIKAELIPFIDTTYRTSKYRAIAGHSLGGLFVTYTLTHSPDLFEGYHLQSPAFGRGTRDAIAQKLSTLFKQNPGLDISFSMTLGDEPALKPGFEAVASIFEEKAPATVQWHADYQLGRSHMQTRMIGIYTALEQSFAADWPLTQAAKSTDINAHFRKLEAKYGTVFYDEEAFSQMTQALLQNRDAIGGAVMAETFLTKYPNSVTARFLLVNAYAVGGDRKRAVEEINAALAFIEAYPEPILEIQQFKQQFIQMKAQLKR